MKKIFLLGFLALFFITACSINQESPDYQSFVFDWAEGSCSSAEDCTEVEYGCGGGHTMCTDNPENWEDVISTCEIVEDHPTNDGYTCTCDVSQNRCGWAK